MTMNKTAFFAALATLAAGGAGGYYAGEHRMLEPVLTPGVTERQAPPAPLAAEPAAVPTARAPICDDTVEFPLRRAPTPGYPAEEGGCGALPTKRCEDFKRAMKPRVAERAVDCLNALSPAQRCDPNRLSPVGTEGSDERLPRGGGDRRRGRAAPRTSWRASATPSRKAAGRSGRGPPRASAARHWPA